MLNMSFQIDGYAAIPIEVVEKMRPHLILPTVKDIEQARERWANHNVERAGKGEEPEPFTLTWSTSFFGDLIPCRDILFDYGLEIKLTRRDSHDTAFYEHIIERLDRACLLSDNRAPSEEYLNSKVVVHVPGNQLLHINSVMLLADACTDSLQIHIKDGWRIIAVCPQPDQRRPDYILGRHDERD